MESKYNAFISYRHSEVDSKIASEIQTQLERFRIPKDITVKTGIKRFERIFRDKEELPITSDLNDDIDAALMNSDNLIVICSTRTGESIWVRKEIETFLKYHEKKNIFTVLVDGEPGEVIPDVLLHDTVKRTLADGTEEIREEMIEPLSCDYRMGIKKARKVELPRLAASMLGCTYDDLIQRRRQYIRRRNSIMGLSAAVLLAAIIGYLTWSLLKIKMNYNLAQENYALAQSNLRLAEENYQTSQENYMQSLRNQSRYLAAESADYLDRGDRVTAVLLALSALPSEGNDRPVTTEAEYALSNALGTYHVPVSSSLDPVWKYTTGRQITKFRLNRDGQILSILDEEGDIVIWNLRDRSEINRIVADTKDRIDLVFDGTGRLIVADKSVITGYDTDCKTVLWTMNLEEEQFPGFLNRSLYYYGDDSCIMYMGDYYVAFIDPSDGNLIEEYYLKEEIPEREDFLMQPSFSDARVSQDGRFAAFSSINANADREMFILDREDGSWKIYGETAQYYNAFAFSPDGKLIVEYNNDLYGSTSILAGATILKESMKSIVSIDPVTAEKEWNIEIPYTMYDYADNIVFLDYTKADGEIVPVAVVLFSNKIEIIDRTTGELLADRELPSGYISYFITSDGGTLIMILRDGRYTYMHMEEGSHIASLNYFSEDVDKVDFYFSDDEHNCFLVQYDKRDIIEYSAAFGDYSYETVPGLPEDVRFTKKLVSGNRIYLLYEDMNLYCIDTADKSLRYVAEIPGRSDTYIDLLCADDEGNLYIENRNKLEGDDISGDRIFRISINAEVEEVDFQMETAVRDVFGENGYLYFMTGRYYEQGYGLRSYNTNTGEESFMPIDIEDLYAYYVKSFAASPDNKHVLITAGDYSITEVYMFDISSGELVLNMTEEITGTGWDASGNRFFLNTKDKLIAYDSNGNKLFDVSMSDYDIVAAAFAGDDIIVVNSYGMVSRYDESGNIKESTDIYVSGDPYEEMEIELFNDDLIISMDRGANVVDLEDFAMRSYIPGYVGYMEESNDYFVKGGSYTDGDQFIACFHKRTIEELIELGKEYIGDSTLSDELRKRYGIS